MKHYLVLMAAIATPAFAEQATLPATTTATSTTLENPSIQLPPTAAQELRQMNMTNDVATVPSIAQATAPVVQQVAVQAPVVATTTVAAPVAPQAAVVPAVVMPVNSQAGTEQHVSNGNERATVIGTGEQLTANSQPLTVNSNPQSGPGTQPLTVNSQPSTVNSQPLTVNSNLNSEAGNSPTPEILQPTPGPDLTQHLFVAFGAVIGLAFFGVTLVRLKKRGALGFGKTDRAQMEVISQMTLSPKRKIILVRIRDQEIALASTEHGITMLTEVSTHKPNRNLAAAIEPKLVGAATREASDANSAKKSESFLNALKNIKQKAQEAERAPTPTPAPTPETATASSAAKAKPTLAQTRGTFPKYLANAFQQEGNRKVNTGNGAGEEENLENVTNMIREKLKNIHQAG